MAKPLEGILVVALEQAVAAPFCTARLADSGARVIKIERSEGDFAREYDHAVHGESAYFVWLNRGKESLVMDFKLGSDAALLHNIVGHADVFVQNLAPGAAARAGFGSESLRARHPRLITCDISGYGEAGPMRDLKAYDLLIQCETGLASVTGTPEAPGRVGVSVADIACGMNAHAAVLEALWARERSGLGVGCAVSLFDAIADWMAVPLLQTAYGGKAPRRVGLAHASIVPYGAFFTADGHQIIIAIQSEREWRSFCEAVLGDAAIAGDVRFTGNAARVQHRAACDALIARRFGELPLATARSLLDRARTAYASLNSVEELLEHPHLRITSVDTPSGAVRLVEPPTRWSGRPYQGGRVPALGEHSVDIRREFA